MALAFAVGVLVGGRSCTAPTQTDTETRTDTQTETVVRDCPENVVYQCPPDAGTDMAEMRAGDAPEVDSIKASADPKLPDAPRPISPRQRQRLLAWVRDQSADLDGCRPSAKETYRLAVTLVLSDEGTVQRVRLNAPRSEVPSDVRGCLRQRMAGWQPPAELVEDRKELVFGLTF